MVGRNRGRQSERSVTNEEEVSGREKDAGSEYREEPMSVVTKPKRTNHRMLFCYKRGE